MSESEVLHYYRIIGTTHRTLCACSSANVCRLYRQRQLLTDL